MIKLDKASTGGRLRKRAEHSKKGAATEGRPYKVFSDATAN